MAKAANLACASPADFDSGQLDLYAGSEQRRT